jgi:hypothetical protein
MATSGSSPSTSPVADPDDQIRGKTAAARLRSRGAGAANRRPVERQRAAVVGWLARAQLTM